MKLKLFNKNINYSIAIFIVFFLVQFFFEYFFTILLYKIELPIKTIPYTSRVLSFIMIGIGLLLFCLKYKIKFEKDHLKMKTAFLILVIVVSSILIIRLILKPNSEVMVFQINYLKFENKFFVLFLTNVILAPIIEEIVFRGIILKRILGDVKISNILAIFITSILFALVHFGFTTMTIAFTLSLIISIIYLYTRNIYYCILFHSYYNFLRLITNNNYSLDSVFTINLDYQNHIVFILIALFSAVIAGSLLFIKNEHIKD